MHRYPIVICHFKGEIFSFGATSILYLEYWGLFIDASIEQTPSCQGSGCRSWSFRRLARKDLASTVGSTLLKPEMDALLCLHGTRFLEVWILLKHNLFTKRSKWKDADRGLLCLRRALQSADGHIPSDSHEYRIVVLLCSAGDACHVFSLYEVLFILILWTLDCL